MRAASANSHSDKGWEMFTDAVITWLNKNLAGVVFLLWGAYAQKKGAHIDTVILPIYYIDLICSYKEVFTIQNSSNSVLCRIEMVNFNLGKT